MMMMAMNVTDRLDRLAHALGILETQFDGVHGYAVRQAGIESEPAQQQQRVVRPLGDKGKEEEVEVQEAEAEAAPALRVQEATRSGYGYGVYTDAPGLFDYMKRQLFPAFYAYVIKPEMRPGSYVYETARRARAEAAAVWRGADTQEMLGNLELRRIPYPDSKKGWKLSASAMAYVIQGANQQTVFNAALHGWVFNERTGVVLTGKEGSDNVKTVVLMGIYDSINIAEGQNWRDLMLGELTPMEVHLHTAAGGGPGWAFSPDTARFRLKNPQLKSGLLTLVAVDPRNKAIMVSLMVLEREPGAVPSLTAYQPAKGFLDTWRETLRTQPIIADT